MKSNQLVHVVANQKGTIIAVSRAGPEPATRQEVQVQLIPLPGQIVAEVQLPDEIGTLETAEHFQRLIAQFELPRGARALRRKKASKKAPPRRPKKRS